MNIYIEIYKFLNVFWGLLKSEGFRKVPILPRPLSDPVCKFLDYLSIFGKARELIDMQTLKPKP